MTNVMKLENCKEFYCEMQSWKIGEYFYTRNVCASRTNLTK